MQQATPIIEIAELAHNQAMLTLTAERRELLASRGRIADLEQLARGQVVLVEQSKKRIAELEAELLEAKSSLVEAVENATPEKPESSE